MVYLIFTLDYEIFGNGQGSLKKLVYNPTQELVNLFDEYNYKFVNFVEVAELIKIKEHKSDNYISKVENQLSDMYKNGYEIGLHIHPQWFNAKYINNYWQLDMSERNICKLTQDKIDNYLDASIRHLKDVLGQSYVPTSFRSGSLPMQPSEKIANALINNKIKIDSSFFKGGLVRNDNIDYREYPNKYFWLFSRDIRKEDENSSLFEFPIYSKNVPFYKMLNKERIRISIKRPTYRKLNNKEKINNYLDKLRLFYPQKLDYCKLTPDNIIKCINNENKKSNSDLIPLILYGHSKNLPNIGQIEMLLKKIRQFNMEVVTFKDVLKLL